MEAIMNAAPNSMGAMRQRVDGSTPASKQREVRVDADQTKAEQAKADQAKREPEAKAVERAADRLNEALQTFNRDLAISVDQDSGKLLVRVTDPGTGDVIRQIPPEQLLEAEVSIDKIIGLFVDDIV